MPKRITVSLSYREYVKREFTVPNSLDIDSPSDVEEWLIRKGEFGEDDEVQVDEAWADKEEA